MNASDAPGMFVHGLRSVHSSPHFMRYESAPLSGSLAWIVHVPDAFTASVVGPENPEITGGLLVELSKYARHCAGFIAPVTPVHEPYEHVAGPPGYCRVQLLHPPLRVHALHCGSLEGSVFVERHCPS